MAKKRAKISNDFFASTTSASPKAEPAKRGRKPDADGKTIPIGVGLKENEVERLDAVSEETGFTRHALMRYAVRYFLKQYEDGNLQLKEAPPKPRDRRLEMP